MNSFCRHLNTLGVTGLAWLAGCLMASNATAQAVDREKSSTVFTVPVEADLDAVFYYDQLTHELRGVVMNNVGEFNVQYRVNLGTAIRQATKKPVAKPIFLVVPGRVNLRNRSGSGATFGGGVIYVTELTTGHMISFGLNWNAAWRNSNKKYMPALRPLDHAQLRPVQLEP